MEKFLGTLKRTLKDIKAELGIPMNTGRNRGRRNRGRRGRNGQQKQQQPPQQQSSSSAQQQQPAAPSSPIGQNAPSSERPGKMSQQQDIQEVWATKL